MFVYHHYEHFLLNCGKLDNSVYICQKMVTVL